MAVGQQRRKTLLETGYADRGAVTADDWAAGTPPGPQLGVAARRMIGRLQPFDGQLRMERMETVRPFARSQPR